MKKIVLCLFSLIILSFSYAQNGGAKLPSIDKSPMDMAYYPANYPVLKIQDKASEPIMARIIYSRPQKNGRIVFGELVEYGQVWRLGANEATEIEFYKDVKIGGKKILKGKYTLYALVNAADWTIILNKETDIWGAFKYDVKKDIVRVKVPLQETEETVEAFTMIFEKIPNGTNLVIAWDNLKTTLPISFK